ncbi:hypothetical protein NEUTE2DRAFT_52638, partial [Neurospora tetrasperma FGSC 2509]
LLECRHGKFAKALLESLKIQERKPDDKGSINLSFSVDSHFKTAITSVRVLSKWRHLSQDEGSALDITEVEQLEINYAPPGMPTSTGEAHSWEPQTHGRVGKEGKQRWYEASVSSLNLEKLLAKNKSLKTGERAEWSPSDLRQNGILESLCCPALQMLKYMDQVGGMENNHQEGKPGTAVKRANERPRIVPGYEVTDEPEASGQGQWTQQGKAGGGW